MPQPGGYADDGTVREVGSMCAALLHRKSIPLDVSFIDLGGDSLLLIALLTEIEERFGVFLGAEDILDDLTASGIASAISRMRHAG